MSRRRAVRLSTADDRTLRSLYKSRRVPIDQYRRLPVELERLTDEFNAASSLELTTGELVHYMICKRKAGEWETFDGEHRRAKALPNDLLADSEWKVVDRLYVETGLGADTYLFDAKLAVRFAARVAKAIGRTIKPDVLASALVDRRKDDDLPRLQSEKGFEDIEDVA